MAEKDLHKKKNIKILVVDDESNIREVLQDFLENEGYEVITADSGVTAISALKEPYPHIVLLDIRMPDMDGLQCLRHIKNINPSIQVVIISGFATIPMAKKSLEMGAFDYINKPLCFNHIKDVINQIKLSKFLEFI